MTKRGRRIKQPKVWTDDTHWHRLIQLTTGEVKLVIRRDIGYRPSWIKEVELKK